MILTDVGPDVMNRSWPNDDQYVLFCFLYEMYCTQNALVSVPGKAFILAFISGCVVAHEYCFVVHATTARVR